MDYPESASQVDSLEFVYNTSTKWLMEIKLKRDGDTAAQTLRQYTYNRFGDVETITDKNPTDTSKTITRSYTYDLYGRPTKEEIRDSINGSTVMESYELEYDKVSNITKETIVNNYHVDPNKRGTEVREYSYDALDQLTSVQVKRGEETISQAEYTYDLVGNRLSEIKDGEATSYVYNSLNQLTSSAKETVVEEGQTPVPLENKTYSYDANGAQVSVSDSLTNEIQESTFDDAGRLAIYVNKVNGTVTLTQTNQYNGAGQRIKKTETAGTNPTDVVNYFYQDGQVLYTTGSDENCAFYILGAGDNIIATEHQDENDIASYHFYNKDLMGSTTNILGAALTSEVTYDYDWFGNTEVFEPTSTNFYNQICYNGGVYDESTQLYYLNARFYNPADGRFLSQDTYRGTIEDANSWHLYAYCANNPVKYSDPTGHLVWFAIGAAFAIYDGVKAYKKAKKEGKSGWRAVASVAKGVAVGAVVGKIGKAFKATTKVYQIGKKVFKTKPLKKLYGKTKNAVKSIKSTYKKSLATIKQKRQLEATNVAKEVASQAGGRYLQSKVEQFACFTAGTKISTKGGDVPIEDIKPGDFVWSENPETGEKGLKEVVKTFVHFKDTLVNVYIDNEKIETTKEHPFWVEGKGWTMAGDLDVGDLLRLQSGKQSVVSDIEIVTLDSPIAVYNFEVADWHTYYVSEMNVLVHNMCDKKLISMMALSN